MKPIDTDKVWYVARTNIKSEDKAAKSLRAVGYRVYVPKMRKTIIHHRTKKQLDRHFLLFNRYIFVATSPANKPIVSARDCDGVEDILRARKDGDWYQVPRQLIVNVMRAQRSGEFDDVSPKSKKDASAKRFAQGSRIQVRSNHSFSGFYGNVVKVKGRGVVKAMLEVFGRTIPVEIEPEFIEPVAA